MSLAIGIRPADELEGMVAAQLIASHNAAMECYRRAMAHGVPHHTMNEFLNQANKSLVLRGSSGVAELTIWGKGQQKVTVEHVHVHAGGQAVVGVAATGGGVKRFRRNNPMYLDMRQAKRCAARTRAGKPCQSPAMPNGRCRMHGGLSPGAPKGNQNAYKHGRYSAAAVKERRRIAELVREMREMAAALKERQPTEADANYPKSKRASRSKECKMDILVDQLYGLSELEAKIVREGRTLVGTFGALAIIEPS